jgi:hypothetical protein
MAAAAARRGEGAAAAPAEGAAPLLVASHGLATRRGAAARLLMAEVEVVWRAQHAECAMS